MTTCKICYVCLDDKSDQVAETTKLLEQQVNGLGVDPVKPVAFEGQIDRLEKNRADHKLDGLIIDLRLDESPNETGERVHYSAQSLAQHLRTLMASQALTPFPIVLWTVNESNLARFYTPDRTSYDLFDAVYWKATVDRDPKQVAEELLSLARGYEAIAKSLLARGNKPMQKILCPPTDESIDSRVLVEFRDVQPVHVYARFILHELIKHPGPLIDQGILLARLGVSRRSKDVDKLVEVSLKKAKYTGPFSDAWPRWWWPEVERWWNSVSSRKVPLTSLPANERVEIISKSLKRLELNVARPIAAGYRTFFSTICQALRQPLDPIDGFVVATRALRPWQDRLYVSAKAALSPGEANFTGELEPSEKERLRLLRAQLRDRREKS